MEVTRTAKIHFGSWLTDTKKLRLTELFSASEDFMSSVLKSVELQVLQGASCFDVLKKGAIARPDTELSARWQQNLIQNVYAMVKAATESAKSTGRKYKTPTISASSITLSNTVTKIVTNSGLRSFDLLLEINCTGMGKIAIPLKKTVFETIMQSPEVLAEKLVYATAVSYPSHVGLKIYWKSTIIPNDKWETEREAIAATLARLKESVEVEPAAN